MRKTSAQGRDARDRTGEGGGEAEKPKKQKNYRRHLENGGDLGGVIKKRRQESFGLVLRA